MTRAASGGAVGRAVQWVVRRVHTARDGGFILLESVIAITVITIVMGAVGVEFVGGMAAVSQQRAQQVAVQMAGSTVEQIRSLHASDLVTGRDQNSVNAQFAAAVPSVLPWLANMDKAADTKAASGSGASAAIPTVGVKPAPTSGSTVAYTLNQYLGWCSVRTTGSTDCVATSTIGGAAATQYLRAVVAVTWTGQRCGPSTTCSYVTSTLVSAGPDRTFRVNAGPYPAPIVVAKAAQSSVVGDTASVQMTVQNGTGVPPFTWAVSSGALPTGLSLGTTGLISGTVQGPAGSYSATIRVTDAFLRSDTQVVTWVVKPALTYDDPGSLANTTADTVNQPLTPRGGDGAPYTFTDPGSSLPPGLVISSAGVVTGRPTSVGTYTVNIRLGDKSGTRSYAGPFTWTVTYPPLAASVPPTQTSTVSTALAPGLQLSASGGNGTYTWSDATPRSLPAGLTLNPSTGLVTGTPTTVGSSTVTVTVTSGTMTKTVSFTWNVVAKPTVAAPVSSIALTIGQSISFNLSSTCPNGPCRYAFNNGPPGLSISASGVVSGTVGGPAANYPTVTITVTDDDGATGTSAGFSVAVKDGPTVSSSAQTDTLGDTVNLQLGGSCPNSPCSYVLNNGPPGLNVSSAGVVNGTIGGTATGYPNATVTVTDAGGVSVTSSPFSWTVLAPPSLSGVTATSIGETATPSIGVTYSCPAAPCTITLGGTLATSSIGIGLSTSAVVVTSNSTRSVTVPDASGTVYLTGLVSTTAVTTGTSNAYGVTLDITDKNGVKPTPSSTTYTAFSSPTISSPGSFTTSQNATVSKNLTYSCSGSPCSASVTGQPAGITLSSSGGTLTLGGRVSSTAPKRVYLVTVSITSSGTTITSSGLWTVQ